MTARALRHGGVDFDADVGPAFQDGGLADGAGVGEEIGDAAVGGLLVRTSTCSSATGSSVGWTARQCIERICTTERARRAPPSPVW